MITKRQLRGMRKELIDKYAMDRFGIALDGRLRKETLIDEVLRLQARSAVDAPDPNGPAVHKEPGRVRVTVTRYAESTGVPLSVNGKRFLIPINKPVSLPAWVVPSLRAIREIEFTVE